MKNLKKRISQILERAEDGDTLSFVFDIAIISLIVLNVAAATAASFESFADKYATQLNYFEIVSIAIFTIEYLLRLWVAPCKYPNSKHPYLKFIFSIEALIDMAAVLPFYLPFVTRLDLRALRIFRILRMFRIFKLGRYSEAMVVIERVLIKEKEKLFATIFLTIVMMFIASTVMYYMENSAQPEMFPNILSTTWWAVATFTTIWYGDIYPITVPGKICGGIISLLGIMLIALPSGIICSGFMEELKGKKSCPHCGKDM